MNVSCTFTCVVAHRHMPRQITEQRAAAQSCQLEPNPKTALNYKTTSQPSGHAGDVAERRALLLHPVDLCWASNSTESFSALVYSVQTLVRDIYANPESEGPCAKTLAEPLSMPMRPSTRSLTGAST